MVVWFRHGSCTVGVEDGVVRAGDFAALTDLLDAARILQTERDRLCADVDVEIAALRETAQAEAEALLNEARATHERAHASGYAEGMALATERWTDNALREAASTQRSLMRQTQRLSQIVSLALERIVAHEDRAALFQRSLAAITKIVRDVPMATLRVSPVDLDSALAAVVAFAPCATGRLQIEVKAEAALPPGSCLFESDQGLVDASLATQLAAIRRAMARAAAHLVLDEPAGPTAVGEIVGLETHGPGSMVDQRWPQADNDGAAYPLPMSDAA